MKDCLIIGPAYCFHYNNVFPLLVKKKLQVGLWTVNTWVNKKSHNGYAWFTTLQVNRPEEKKLKLTKTYNEQDYQRYDNYDAIESTSKDVPVDYDGLIGVPISFLKYYPYFDYDILEKRGDLKLNGKQLFQRLIIQKKNYK